MRFSASDLSDSILAARPAVLPYLTAGFPDMGRFVDLLDSLSTLAPAIEIGLPFSDPMADGATIQDSSRISLEGGTTVGGVLSALGERDPSPIPLAVMSYLNPLLAFGPTELFSRLSDVGVAALVIPDLPFEESGPIRELAGAHFIGLVQLVTPVTPVSRLETLAKASEGFTYAVTMAGTTGGTVALDGSVAAYLDQVREHSAVPVVAGFGIRNSTQVHELADHCDGVIVGSALVEKIAAGSDAAEFVRELAT